MKVAPLRRPPLSAHTRARTRRRARWNAFCACAHTYAYICMLCCVHTYARTHVPSRARLVRARSRPARPCVGASARPRERGGGGTHRNWRFGHSTAAGSAASSVEDASLRATVRPRRAVSAPSVTRVNPVGPGANAPLRCAAWQAAPHRRARPRTAAQRSGRRRRLEARVAALEQAPKT